MKEKSATSKIRFAITLPYGVFFAVKYRPTIEKSESGWSFRRMPKYAMRGVAGIRDPHRPPVLPGSKAERPETYQSADQKEFQKLGGSAGALYPVVRAIEEVQQLGFVAGSLSVLNTFVFGVFWCGNCF